MLVGLADVLFESHVVYTTAVVEGYRQESAQLLRAAERERAVLVEAVLDGDADDLWEVAQSLKLPLTGVFIVIAAEASDLGHDPLPRIEPMIAALGVNSAWRLESNQALAVLALPAPDRESSVLDLLQRQATGRVGVSPTFPHLRNAPQARRLAQLALERSGPGELTQFQDTPLDRLVAAAPRAALETSRVVLGALLTLPPDDQQLLLTTFEEWLRAEGSVKDTAAAMFCHPNTVRYRLRRLESKTGRSLTVPGQLAELVTATRAWSQLPRSD